MTLTHLSHFDVTDWGGNAGYRRFNGAKQDCLRVAYAHGAEIQYRDAGRIELTNDTSMWVRNDGTWELWIPRPVWDNF